MDPNECLRELIWLCKSIQDDEHPWFSKDDTTERVADLVVSLDEWIAKGGFLPERWQKKEG
jgi:hypothetical protein